MSDIHIVEESSFGTLTTFIFLSCKKRNSPYINRFLSADTIVPGAANPQALNRYSYVLGNPLKYTDPSGHMQESDDDDCYGCTPPPAPVVIINPDPLDDEQEQDDPTPALNDQDDVVTDCTNCIIFGGAVIVATGILELVFGAAGVAAVVFSGPGAIEPLALILPIEALLVNIQLVGIEMIKQGENRAPEDVSLDYLPLVHLITNPNEGDYFK
jgi:hypothetical protein